MKVTFHGVRGSIPTPGPSTVRYGGNSVCVEVRLADGTLIVLDAGSGIRALGNELMRADKLPTVNLLITHGHWDHILGLPFFGPMYHPDAKIVFHPVTVSGRERLRNPIMFDGEHFPVRYTDLPAKIENDDQLGDEFRIGSARITHVALHHPGGAIGYRIDDDDGSSLCYLTDNELVPAGPAALPIDELARFAHGTSLMIHDAQYLPADMPAKRGWGHSVVDDVLELARTAEVRAVALHHHDPDRDDAALDAIANGAAAWTQSHAPQLTAIVAREGLTLDLAEHV